MQNLASVMITDAFSEVFLEGYHVESQVQLHNRCFLIKYFIMYGFSGKHIDKNI